ncbi:hypothetical protein [Natrinema salsiterrestre]|uniref:Uncharacterized protein n=1 Tax=Natrinema salsiterrestre TaxID=2950540 RepID=A0A9Q4L6F6_9EURY|nr:hypothetical protein [Natrinema salsiterrestre]MDF9748389.1 hypothetical protein [Natrinema salsiterrestre]
MSKTAGDVSTDTPKVTECPVRAAEHYTRHNDRHYATRGEVIGSLARGGSSLEEAHAAIHDELGDGLLRPPDDPTHLDPTTDAEALLAFLESYLEHAEEPDSDLVGQINARRQELRDGGDA